MNPSPPELFSQRPIRSDFGRAPSYRTRRIITMCVCLLLIGGILYRVLGGSPVSGGIPTIKAETGSWKQRPEQPGGIDIPHQDVEVYQALDNKDSAEKPGIEHLLPPPETPQQPATVTTTASNTPSPPPISAAPPSQPENLAPQPSVADVETIMAPPTPAPVATTVPSPSQPVKVMPAPPPVSVKSKPDAMEQVLKNTVKSGKTARVQLAAVQDNEDAANQIMKQLQGRYASILGDTQLRLVRADLGDKGIYYRIQSQSISDDQANDICAAIKKSKAGCLLVR